MGLRCLPNRSTMERVGVRMAKWVSALPKFPEKLSQVGKIISFNPEATGDPLILIQHKVSANTVQSFLLLQLEARIKFDIYQQKMNKSFGNILWGATMTLVRKTLKTYRPIWEKIPENQEKVWQQVSLKRKRNKFLKMFLRFLKKKRPKAFWFHNLRKKKKSQPKKPRSYQIWCF